MGQAKQLTEKPVKVRTNAKHGSILLNTFDQKSGKRAWKALPLSVMDQLHHKGYISDPATKNKSVCLSDEGARLSEELFQKLFAVK